MQTPRVNLSLKNIEDIAVRQEMKTVDEYLNSTRHPFLGFIGKVYRFGVIGIVNDLEFTHALGFVPNAAWIVWQSDSSVSVSLKYEDFTNQIFVLSTSGTVDFDILVGKFT